MESSPYNSKFNVLKFSCNTDAVKRTKKKLNYFGSGSKPTTTQSETKRFESTSNSGKFDGFSSQLFSDDCAIDLFASGKLNDDIFAL